MKRVKKKVRIENESELKRNKRRLSEVSLEMDEASLAGDTERYVKLRSEYSMLTLKLETMYKNKYNVNEWTITGLH